MRKKGFTLIELLGVIVILGIISVLIVPVVNNMLLESREKLAKAQEESILKAAKNWGHANMFLLPDCDGAATCGDTITVTLGLLMNDGFLDNQTIKDVQKNKIYSEATEIVVGKKNNQNTYTIGENPFSDEIDMPEGGPSIVFNGSSTITEEANRDGSAYYKEPGLTVKNKDNTDIGYTIEVIRISLRGVKENTQIYKATKAAGSTGYEIGFNTQTVANYKIIYTATANGKTAKNIRNIQVKDTTPPTISFVSNIEVDYDYAHLYRTKANGGELENNVVVINPTLSSAVANQQRADYLKQISKVVVMDNSCDRADLNISITSDIPKENLQEGTYAITYKVTDKYKNSLKKTRMVRIIKN